MVWQRFAKPPGREPVQVRLLPPPLESRGWRIEDRGSRIRIALAILDLHNPRIYRRGPTWQRHWS